MHMKEDHMRNGQLKPGYNIQAAVEGEYILGILKNGHISDAHIRMLFKQVNVHQNEDKSIDISFEMNGGWEGSKAIYVDPGA